MVEMVPLKRQVWGNAVAVALALCVAAGAVCAQAPGTQNRPDSNSGSGSNSGSKTGVTNALGQAIQAQQELAKPGPSVTPSNSSTGSIDTSYRGSLVRDKATDGVLALSIDDAMQRGLKNNLGLILQSSNEQQAGGQRLQQLQNLLPKATGQVSIEVQQINLAAFGLKFPGLNPIIGPFQTEDFRMYLTQSLFNLKSFQDYLAARHNFEAAKLSAQDARDLVVLTVGNAYLLCIADAARIEAVKAEMETSKVSLDQANAAHEAGTSPRLDVLRAQVDYQNEQQQLIATTNDLAKDKLALARTIGLPLEQKFELSDTAPFAALDVPDADKAFAQALKQRKDLAAAEETLKGAEAEKKSANIVFS